MLRKYLFPGIAISGVLLSSYMVYLSNKTPPVPPIEFPPPVSPYISYIAAAGIVESASENVAIGAPFNEIITSILCQTGQVVEEGTPLFELDTRELKAQAEEKRQQLALSEQKFVKLIKEPRPEELPIYENAFRMSEADFLLKGTQYELVTNLHNKTAVSQEDFFTRKYSKDAAYFAMLKAQAELELKKSGAWIEDIKVATEEMLVAKSAYEIAKVQLDRALVRAPFKGQVLRINAHPGEYTDLLNRTDPIIVFGNTDVFHVRVDVDEEEAWRVLPNAQAILYLRGNSRISVPLEFVRIEPYIIPKKSLTGDNSERVDTRVLQVIYKFHPGDKPIYIGQITDVFMQAKPLFEKTL